MEHNFTEFSTDRLLSYYRRLTQNPPLTYFASNEELDEYYDTLYEVKAEIARRSKDTDEV